MKSIYSRLRSQMPPYYTSSSQFSRPLFNQLDGVAYWPMYLRSNQFIGIAYSDREDEL